MSTILYYTFCSHSFLLSLYHFISYTISILNVFVFSSFSCLIPTEMIKHSTSLNQLWFTSLLPTFVLFIQYLTPATARSYPCPYSQTVNITDGLRLKDGSYSFEGLVIPFNLTAEYTFKVIDGIEYDTPRHLRGCACLLKPCITFCCPPKMHYNEAHQNCTLNEKESHSQHTHIEVTLRNGSVDVVNIKNAFIVRYEFGCKSKYIEKKKEDFWKWDLFEVSNWVTYFHL